MTANIKLEDLGLTQEELQRRVIATVATQFLDAYVAQEQPDTASDEDADEDDGPRKKKTLRQTVRRELLNAVKKEIADQVQLVVSSELREVLKQSLENLVIDRTNRYGEVKAPPVTFREYVIAKAKQLLNDTGDSRTVKTRTKTLRAVIDEEITKQVKDTMKATAEEFGRDLNAALRDSVADVVKKAAGRIEVRHMRS